MIIEGNTAVPYGNGAFSDCTGGVPQPASFHGQSNWFTVPNSWYSKTDSQQQIWVSPNENFSPQFAAKIDLDGRWVFRDTMKTLVSQRQ